MLRLWVTMAGQAGAGKSTLAGLLAEELRRRGHPVDAFGEEELFTRAEFTGVAEEFRTKSHPGRAPFEAAYGAWLRSAPEGGIAIMDWSPAGMAGDLPWGMAARSEYPRHLRTVRALARGRVILLHLESPVSVAVARAAAQRGEEWLARYDQIARAGGHEHPERLARIIGWASDHVVSTEVEVEAAAEAGWQIHSIDGAQSTQEVLIQALTIVGGHLSGGGRPTDGAPSAAR